ncbi:YiiX/YebB-like N1pC/P60 family cysteine hydrolase [Breoghania sp. JC706]|uniref:YiiX/YebB-like N1pC/P60 family cysteine hydrolase n=1 Tax=Breoghania sp. JC706 TaxID=3117732 RepID=UPI003009323F
MRTGDLIFSAIGHEDNAISAVTVGYRGARLNHMGVVAVAPFGEFVLEAFYPEVKLTPFQNFARRSHDDDGRARLMLGRLRAPHTDLIDRAMEYGFALCEMPYDELYLTGNGALYCSELVVNMFRHANDGAPFFVEEPMSFRDIATGKPHPAWIEYYACFGMDVPEGAPGSNPGAISRDERLEIYDITGPIPGLEQELL